MKIQNTFIGLFAIILLAISTYGLASSDHRLVLTDDDTPIVKRGENEFDPNIDPNNTATTTTTISTTTLADNSTSIPETTDTNVNITTTVEPTPSPTTTVAPTTSPTTTVAPAPSSTTTVESSSATTVEPSSTTTAAPTASTTITQSPTPGAPGRKFDGLSFFGGMILAVGLGALIYLVIRYLRRSNRLPYSNLH